MAERAVASRSASNSAYASGTATTSSSPPALGMSQPTPTSAPLPPVQTEAPPPVHTGAPPPPPPHDQLDIAVTVPVHPELDVSDHVPYATLRVEDILAHPGHDILRRLDPKKIANTYWFKFDNMVACSIADNIKGYFTEAHPNWTNTPEHIKKT
ncbi:unnamed protein product [Cochlearia groenlandica]